ncbi:MAG: D-glycerate dehydrogenase [Dehalococcoidia bacterium]|nr:MAG: D-glycerate dehydrogenase [Dehalococcoidia bacterium]
MSGRPRVFVSRMLPGGDAPGSPVADLRARTDLDVWDADGPPLAESLRTRSAPCEGLLTMLTERVDALLLDAAPRVRVVANMAVGYDNIDIPACTARGVLVTNTPGVLTEATADMTWALLLAAARRLPEGERAVRDGEWGPWHPTWLLGHRVSGATLGIVGPGRIGRAVAQRAQGFGMTVLYAGHRAVADFPGSFTPLDDLLARAEYVSMHVPLTPETERMCDASFFARMRPDAIFVNTTRGGVVDQPALAAALRSGQIAGAGIDVMTPEPMPAGDPLLTAPHLVVAPHLGSATLETRAAMARLAVEGLLAGLEGRMPANAVNPEALTAKGRRA